MRLILCTRRKRCDKARVTGEQQVQGHYVLDNAWEHARRRLTLLELLAWLSSRPAGAAYEHRKPDARAHSAASM